MPSFLLHPRATMCVVVAACFAIDSACIGIANAVSPLQNVHAFAALALAIQQTCAGLALVSNGALVLAAMGRSIISAIDTFKLSDAELSAGTASGAPQAPTSPGEVSNK